MCRGHKIPGSKGFPLLECSNPHRVSPGRQAVRVDVVFELLRIKRIILIPAMQKYIQVKDGETRRGDGAPRSRFFSSYQAGLVGKIAFTGTRFYVYRHVK